MAIPKSNLLARTWYVGTSRYSSVALWDFTNQVFVCGYAYPGSDPSPLSMLHADDLPDNSKTSGFTPTAVLNPQLPQNWTPAQSIQASETQKRIQDGQG